MRLEHYFSTYPLVVFAFVFAVLTVLSLTITGVISQRFLSRLRREAPNAFARFFGPTPIWLARVSLAWSAPSAVFSSVPDPAVKSLCDRFNTPLRVFQLASAIAFALTILLLVVSTIYG